LTHRAEFNSISMTTPSDSVLSAAPRAHVHHPTRTIVLAFATVYFFWGATFLAIRYGVQSIPPLLMQGTRHLVAGVALFSIARARGAEAPTRRQWLGAAMVGGLLLLGGNGILAYAERVLPSGVSALLVATVSLWIAIIEWLRPGGTRPTYRVAAGLALGFLGVAVLVSPGTLFGHSSGEPIRIIPALALILGAMLWATGSMLSRHVSLPRSALLAAAMYALTGGTLLWIVGLGLGEGATLDIHAITLRSWLSILYLAIFGSFLGLSAYAFLLHNVAPSRVATYAYVNPIVAVLLGWAVAGERITPQILIAAAVIIVSVVLVITAPKAPVAADVGSQPAMSE
jgi:drug/metabolite transporter (DMT)-like permease